MRFSLNNNIYLLLFSALLLTSNKIILFLSLVGMIQIPSNKKKLFQTAIFYYLLGVFSLEIILDRNFGQKKLCLEGIENNMKYLNGELYTQICDKRCSISEFNYSEVAMTVDIIGDLGLLVVYDMGQYIEPYSYIQIDFSFINFGDARTLSVDINGQISQQFTATSTQSIYEDRPQLVCYQKAQNLYTSSLVLNKKLNNGEELKIKFNEASSSPYYYVPLRSIKITKNCTPNCSVCLADESCKVCQDGFQKYQFVSGPSVCEQIGKCTINNCFSCAKYGAQEVCMTCSIGFTFDSDKNCVANTPQPQTPCQANEYVENGKCVQYSSIGYYESQNGLQKISSDLIDIQKTYKCPKGTLAVVLRQQNYQVFQCRCFITNCQSCSQLNTCDACITGYKFNPDSSLCEKLNYSNNGYQLNQEVTETGYLIKIQFENELVQSQLDVSNLKIAITNIKKYTYTIQGIENKNTIVIVITCNENVKDQNIEVAFEDPQFLTQNLIKNSSLEQPIKTYVQISEEDRKDADNLNSSGKAVSKTIVYSFIPIAILGNFFLLINTIDVIGFLYYLLFLDVRFPINIFQFYEIFKNFQLSFIPNIFEGMVSDGYTQTSHSQFMQQQYDSYFIISTGQILTVFLIIFLVYLTLKALSFVKIDHVQPYLKRKIYETWEYGGLFDAVWIVYIYVLVGCMLQFYDYDCSDKSCGFNYFFHSLWVLITFSMPVLVTYLMVKNPNIKCDRYMSTKLSSLISGLQLFGQKESLISREDEQHNTPPQTNNLFPNLSQTHQSQSYANPNELNWHQKLTYKFSRYHMPLLYIRKFIFCFIIVYLYNSIYAQIALIIAMNIFVAAYYILVQPYERKYENFKNTASELLLIVVSIIIAILKDDSQDQDEQQRIKLGWIAIGLIAFILVSHALGIIFFTLQKMFEYFKSIKQRRNRLKVANFEEQIGDTKQPNDQSPISQAKKRLSPKENAFDFQNVKEMPVEEEDDQTENQSPLQSQRMRRAKFSQIQREGSINNMDTFVDMNNQSPDNSPKRHRTSRLSVTALNNQAQQPEEQQVSMNEFPTSNNQIMTQIDRRNSTKGTRFTKIRSILES